MSYEARKVDIDSIKPNPFRDLKMLSLDSEKVKELEESIRKLGYWENIIARENGNGYQLAFGHHRIKALKNLGKKKITIQVNPAGLTDDQMFDYMVRENKTAYGERRAAADQHDVLQLLRMVAQGKTELEAAIKTGGVAIPHTLGEHLTVDSAVHGTVVKASAVAKRMGWDAAGGGGRKRAERVLRQIRLTHSGHAKGIDYSSLSPTLAIEITEVVNQIEDPKVAEKIGRELSDKAKSGLATRAVKSEAAKIAEKHGKELVRRDKKKRSKEKDINDAMRSIARELTRAMPISGDTKEKIDAVIKHQKHAKESRRWELKMTLRRVAERCTRLADKIDAPDMTLSEASRKLYDGDQEDVNIRGFLVRR